MGMFGGRPKKETYAFDPILDGIGGGLVQQRPDLVSPSVEHSFFGQGGAGRNIAGYIGDALQRIGGGQATYAPAMQQQRMEQREQARIDAADARAMKPQVHYGEDGGVYSFDPSTGQVTTIREGTGKKGSIQVNDEYFQSIDPTGALSGQYRAQAAAGPPQIITTPQGTFAVPRGGFGGGAPAAPQMPAVGSVVADPRKRGGASPSGSPTFR